MNEYKGWTLEELLVSTIKVGDRVEAPRHGRGKVLAIAGNDAWVQTEGKDYPLTFDLKKLRLVPKPKVGIFTSVRSRDEYGGVKSAAIEWHVDAVELTDEVRERLAGLL